MYITTTVCDLCGNETKDYSTASIKWCNQEVSQHIHVCKEKCYAEVEHEEEKETFAEIIKKILPKWIRYL